jgi:hypothetical protein
MENQIISIASNPQDQGRLLGTRDQTLLEYLGKVVHTERQPAG